MHLTVKESPSNDRPRERLIAMGPSQLRIADLIAILIRSGRAGESAVQAGEKLAAAFRDNVERLPDAAHAELKSISKTVGPTAFCQIMAGIELGRRIAQAKQDTAVSTKISGTASARAFCESHFSRLMTDGSREELHIVCLDTKNKVIETHMISVGTLDASLVHPREVFRPAIKSSSASIILVHNHPSGDPTPSPEDRSVTDRIEAAGKTLGIGLLDHIVLGANRSVSIREDV